MGRLDSVHDGLRVPLNRRGPTRVDLDEKLSFSYVLDEKYQPTDILEDEPRYHLLAAERYILSKFTPETARLVKATICRGW